VRHKFFVRRRKEIIGLWYNPTIEMCYVAGPKSHRVLAEEVLGFLVRYAKVSRPPKPKVVDGCRIRAKIPMKRRSFEIAYYWLMTEGLKELDVTIQRTKTFRRLCA